MKCNNLRIERETDRNTEREIGSKMGVQTRDIWNLKVNADGQ